MLCYENGKSEFDIIEEHYNKEFAHDTILEITGMFDDGYSGIYPGEQYCGISIKTNNHVICVHIGPDTCRLGRYGSILSHDDLEAFIGSQLRKIYFTNTANNVEYIDYIRSLKGHSTEFYNIQFINFETDKGIFQLTVYNCDNGYYGRDIVVRIDESVEYKKTVSGWQGILPAKSE